MSSTRSHLLIVDDERSQMQALCDTLRDQGYEVSGFSSPDLALDALREGEHLYELLLTDLMMPGMNGIELLRAARELDPDMVGIVMTGQGSIGSAVEAMQAGALDYILKPFNLSMMLPVISRAISIRNLRVENASLEKGIRERTKQLLEANKELEAFAHSVSHDLRSPLNSIIGFSQILMMKESPDIDDSNRKLLGHIFDSGKQMNELINDLLRLSKISQQEIQRTHVDLSPMAKEVIDLLRSSDPNRQISVEIEPNLFAEGDSGLLRIVLDNLLGNAWKYTGKTEYPEIRFISFASDTGERGYLVSDNGAGFDMSEADRLFEPFKRMHLASDFPGTGIGLSIVHRIIERHSGRIWADSAPEHGARFFFTLRSP